jgi:hypothetical protein
MAHTPGPWWIDEDGDYLCICEGEVNEYGEREEVATLACNRPSLLLCQPANARLIAAAPELLASLRWLVSSAKMRSPVGGWAYMISDRRMEEARAAIAKAEGITMEDDDGKERSLD